MNTAQSIISPERIERAVRTRYSPFPELTMDALAQQLKQFRVGDLRPAARSWEIMMEWDGDLAVPAEKLYSDIARLPIEVEKAADTAEADAHAASLQFFVDHLTARSVLDGDERGGASLLLRQLMSAHAMRYSVHEMILDVHNAARREVTATFYHCPVWFFEARKGRLAYLKGDYDLQGEPLERGKWLTGVGRGMMRQCSVAYLAKWQATAYNLLFCHRFGVPGIHGETDAAKGSPEWADFTASLAAFANDWVTATNLGAKVNIIESGKGGAGSLPFAEVIERADRLFARAFRGGDLSTQSRAGGDVSGSDAQAGEKDLILVDGGQWAGDTLNAGVVEPLIEYLYGTAPQAWLRVRPPKQSDTTREVTALKAAREIGVPVSVATARERLGLPTPEEGEELLPPPAPAALGQPGPTEDPVLARQKTFLQFKREFEREKEAAEVERVAALANSSDAQARLAAALADKVDTVGLMIRRITEIKDDGQMLNALRDFLARADEINKLVTADVSRAAVALEQVTAPALASGLAGKTALANKGDEEDGVWRTVGGRPVFIKTGEDIGAALARRDGHQGSELHQDRKGQDDPD